MSTSARRILIAIAVTGAMAIFLFRFAAILPLKDGYYQCTATEQIPEGTPFVKGTVIRDDSIYIVTAYHGEMGPDWDPKSLLPAKEGTRRFEAGIAVNGDGRYYRYACTYSGILRDENGNEIG